MAPIRLFDTHCHLTDPQFDPDREEVVSRAREQGVTDIIVIATSLEDSESAARIAHQYNLYFTAGIHPHNAQTWSPSQVGPLCDLLNDPRCAAVGEIGLDFYRRFAPPDIQIALLRDMLSLAQEVGKPVVLHNRAADEALWGILSLPEYNTIKALFHCFSSAPSFARRVVGKGHYISLAGNATYPRFPLQEALSEIPTSQLLVETDAPYLSPHPLRGRRNEPAYLIHTANALAQALSIPLPQLGEITYQNALRFFSLMEEEPAEPSS